MLLESSRLICKESEEVTSIYFESVDGSSVVSHLRSQYRILKLICSNIVGHKKNRF